MSASDEVIIDYIKECLSKNKRMSELEKETGERKEILIKVIDIASK